MGSQITKGKTDRKPFKAWFDWHSPGVGWREGCGEMDGMHGNGAGVT